MWVKCAQLSALVFLALLIGPASPTVFAAENDLSTNLDGPYGAGPGGVANITVSYHNAGPDPALSAYVLAYIPSGVPAPIADLTQDQIDALIASVVPDGLGNSAFLYLEETACEHLIFQINEDDGDPLTADPIVGLGPGVTGSVSFGLEIPMDPPDLAGLYIDEPSVLAMEYKPATGVQWLTASDWGRYTPGVCDGTAVLCDDLSTCFGPRVSYTDPISADFELVDDGTAEPTWACEPLVGFTAGNIAVIERGSCEFGAKALNAQQAGAVAVVMVNDGRCVDPNPPSPKCAINMGGGVFGAQVTIPIVMLSVNDGQLIIDALVAATPVHGGIGTVSDKLTLDSWALLNDPGDNDPNAANDVASIDVLWAAIFADDFESGDTTAWSSQTP
jgi:hypothetical protein